MMVIICLKRQTAIRFRVNKKQGNWVSFAFYEYLGG